MNKKVSLDAMKRIKREQKEHGMALMDMGKVLGINLIEQLSAFGSGHDGLVVETVAMGMAWAALKAIAYDKGFDPNELFQRTANNFEDEMTDYVYQADSEK